MIRVALVGNIASGKSTVDIFLQELGYLVLDTDKVSHCLLENNPEVIKAFSSYDILDENHNISREKLGKVVFSDKNLKAMLEKILHPQIRLKILEFFENNKSEKVVFVAIPLLFEANMQDLFDKILFVYTNDEIRLKRLISRNNYSEEYAKIRLKSQLSQDEKIKKADYVIYNNSTKEELRKEVVKVLEQIR